MVLGTREEGPLRQKVGGDVTRSSLTPVSEEPRPTTFQRKSPDRVCDEGVPWENRREGVTDLCRFFPFALRDVPPTPTPTDDSSRPDTPLF